MLQEVQYCVPKFKYDCNSRGHRIKKSKKLTLDVANNKPGASSSGGDTTTKEESITSTCSIR